MGTQDRLGLHAGPRTATIALLGLGLTLAACSGERDTTAAPPAKAAEERTAWVDGDRIRAANETPGEWLSHGRTYDEQRHSPLDQINTDNVDQLGLAWHFKLDVDRGTEATPIVVDGVMYTTGPYSIVYALARDRRAAVEVRSGH